MVFSSLEFLFRFLPIFLCIYYVTPKKYRNATLFAGSLIFYTIGEAMYCFLLFASVLVNYVLGRCMYAKGEEKQKGTRQKIILVAALLFDFGMLFFFKYSGFFAENLNFLFEKMTGKAGVLPVVSLSLPLGISFYTFQIAAYIIDVYRQRIKAEKALVNLGTYLTMFPQLIAGPIINYTEVEASLKQREITYEDFEEGIKLLSIGLGAKVIVADRIGTLWSSIQAIGFESISTPLAWMGAFAYSLQLYFDFSGYSMMAMGLGKMLGFEIPVNFDHPYISKSITEFWRRWHITLGRWFREYVYIPLGGNRVGKARLMFNLVVVWLLTAIWHGAGWNFLLWGITLLVFMLLEKFFLLKYLEKSKVLSHAYLLLIVPVTWIMFAITDMGQLQNYLIRMFPFVGTTTVTINKLDYIKYLKDYWYLFAVGFFFASPVPSAFYKVFQKKLVGKIAIMVIFWISIYYLAISVNNPFLYFNF